MLGKIRIGLVEDHKFVRQGLVSLIDEEPSLKIVFDVSDGAELFDVLKIKKADVILLDIEMPRVDGKSALSKLKSNYPNTSVVMLSAHSTIDDVVECIALGAKGFIPKHADFDKVLDAIFSVYEKGFYFDEYVTQSLVKDILRSRQSHLNIISPPLNCTELKIVRLVCEGLTNAQIAGELCLSKRTIEGHRLKISNKTKTSNIPELVIYAIRNSIIQNPV
jgi:DNA-binding NarL/FixJ family response regulator